VPVDGWEAREPDAGAASEPIDGWEAREPWQGAIALGRYASCKKKKKFFLYFL
jgi:hypothetical protein